MAGSGGLPGCQDFILGRCPHDGKALDVGELHRDLNIAGLEIRVGAQMRGMVHKARVVSQTIGLHCFCLVGNDDASLEIADF